MSYLFSRTFQIDRSAEVPLNRRMMGMADFATSMLKEKPQSFTKTLVSSIIPGQIPTKQYCSIWEFVLVTASFSLFKIFFWKSNREAAAEEEEVTIQLSHMTEQWSMTDEKYRALLSKFLHFTNTLNATEKQIGVEWRVLRSELCLEFSRCQMELRAGLNKEHARREMEMRATLNKEHKRREMEIRATLNEQRARREMEISATLNEEHARREMEIRATLNKEHARREMEIRATLNKEHAKREMAIRGVLSEEREMVAHLEKEVEECTAEKNVLEVDLEKLKSDSNECKMLPQRYEDDTQDLGARVISCPLCNAAAASGWEDEFEKRFLDVFGSEIRTVSLVQAAEGDITPELTEE